jgi:hypothetical protein
METGTELAATLRDGRASHGLLRVTLFVAARTAVESAVARRWFGVFARLKACKPSVDLLSGRMQAGCLILGQAEKASWQNCSRRSFFILPCYRS